VLVIVLGWCGGVAVAVSGVDREHGYNCDHEHDHEQEHDGVFVICCMTRGRRGVRVGGMQADVPRSLMISADLSHALMEAAVKSAAKGAQRMTRPKRGVTLKPGVDTPLWNELANAVKAQLGRRGEKAKLARILGVPRQRVHDLFNKRSALPDAERTLLLLAWLQARNQGRELG
jgi:hypothetical protein